MSQITEDKKKVYEGLFNTANVVGSTMGAQGKFVLIDDKGKGRFTKDGITAATATLNATIGEQKIGAELVVNSSMKTVEECGDGTTTTAVLLKAMAERDTPENKRDYLENLRKDLDIVISNMTDKSKELKTLDELENIATTSGNSKDIGNLVRKVYEEVGMDSLVLLDQDDDSTETYFKVAKGVEFRGNTGYISPAFGNQRNKYCIFEDSFVVIDEDKHSRVEGYTKLIQEANKQGKPIVFISPKFSREVISFVLGNVRKGLQACLVKAPGWGRNKSENYKDIKALLSREGTAKKIVITPVSFTIFSDEDTSPRIAEVEGELEGYMQEHEIEFAKKRINKLRGTTATIYTGGVTEKNMEEEYDRIEDALGAVKAAIEGGYIKGAGISLAEAAKGTSIEDVCNAPAFRIKSNAGLPEDLKEINVITKKECDLLMEGIIDPLKVAVCSLNNAYASISLLINTDYIIKL